MRYKIVLGDYSGDGHSITEDVFVEVKGDFTREQLETNFKKNVEEWGFSPYDIADEYDSGEIAPEHAAKLLEVGLDPAIFDDATMSEEYVEQMKTVFGASWIYQKDKYRVGRIDVDQERLVEIAMFYVGHGLDGFEWSEVQDSIPTLLGGWDGFDDGNPQNGFLGYGLFGQ